ncbi:8693_t:CDS:2 [Diversispora eburnea]|uniref:8693_t:CDS:1 n=1 Tax=Diversispora eburnea TaxID=1213867 RepID=A0A9N8YYG1_9GLOM|nr:8693_t:CDS:2 [Diversispora eburnea]
MATKIPTEILIKILNNNVQSSHDLYSSLLVNRTWCKVTIPILWELPLGQKYLRSEKLMNNALCIRTYISCMDTQARTLLTQNGFDLSLSPPQTTFDYPSFTRRFRIDNLAYYVFYSQKIIGSDNDITKSRILFREICKLIINRCTFLDSFKITEVHGYFCKKFLNSDLIGTIIKLPGASKVFKKLETFVSVACDDELTRPLYESFALICDNILNMDLKFNSSRVQLLEKLISVQKRLESLSIIGNGSINYNSLLLNIISQKETLKSLRLKSVNFYNFEEKLSPIGQFSSLQELYIENCYGLCKSDCLFFASSFTQLSSFHLSNLFYEFSFGCGKELDANILLCQMAESVPESLVTIEIKMGTFSADSLRKFFEGWCCKGGGRNKKMIVSHKILLNEHYKVIKEYGVQFGLV